MHIAIVSAQGDLHALIVQRALQKHAGVACDIVESDRICESAILNWSNVSGGSAGRVPAMDGRSLDVADLDLIWWRRAGYPQKLPDYVVDPAQIDLIHNDCRVALAGVLLEDFRGTWIDHPLHSQLASNKLVQLRAAQRAGFRVPRTLVSQDPAAVRRFCEELNGEVVVKAVSGSSSAPLLTTKLTADHLRSDESIALCPTIYQEYIPGERHVRVQCFGKAIYAVAIESRDLDWRGNLNVPVSLVELPAAVEERLRAVLKLLGLKMGIVDLKFTADGDVVWFEINPQGQFLFVQGLSGVDLISAFVNFLCDEARLAGA
jgi:glutathione synthase/RimK-type ligase-like ATP-grasp enzyme